MAVKTHEPEHATHHTTHKKAPEVDENMPETQEEKEDLMRKAQQVAGEQDADFLEKEIEAIIKPLKDRTRDQYRDFRAASGNVKLANPPAPGGGSTGRCVRCDNPVALGQNYHCRHHIRVG